MKANMFFKMKVRKILTELDIHAIALREIKGLEQDNEDMIDIMDKIQDVLEIIESIENGEEIYGHDLELLNALAPRVPWEEMLIGTIK